MQIKNAQKIAVDLTFQHAYFNFFAFDNLQRFISRYKSTTLLIAESHLQLIALSHYPTKTDFKTFFSYHFEW